MVIRFLPDKINKDEAAKAKIKANKIADHLFKYKAFQKQLLKDLQKAKKFMGEEPGAEMSFFLSVKHEYPDKKGKDMPLLVVGKITGHWKNYIKERIKDKEAKKFEATGTLRFDESKKQETGISYLELSIEKGKAKRKLIKKLIDKWLMPGGLEISFSGSNLENEEVANMGDAPIVSQDDELGNKTLDPKDKVQALFIALKKGDYKKAPKKEHAVRAKIRSYIDNWVLKYEMLDNIQKRKEPIASKKGNYDYILNWLDNDDDGKKADPGLSGITADFKIDLKSIPSVGRMDKMRGTNYSKIVKALEVFNKTTDLARKRELFEGIMGMMKKWLDGHRNDKIMPSQFKALDTLFGTLEQYKPEQNKTKLDTHKKKIHKDSESFSGTKTLFDETAGTKESSKLAKDVRDATVDDRAIRLANMLKRGKASNDDKTFGAVMKWLADNVFNELEDKYREATKHVFGAKKESNLIGDILSVFKAGSLRTHYLLDKLKGNESPYASLAFKLGLMGETWRDSLKGDGIPTAIGGTLGGAGGGALGSLLGPAGIMLGAELGLSFGAVLGSTMRIDGTIEREDAMSEIIDGYGAKDIDIILNAPKDASTYKGAIRLEIETNHPNMLKQIKSNLEIKEFKLLMDLPADIEKLKKIIAGESNEEKKEECEALLAKLQGQEKELKKKHGDFKSENLKKANDKYLCDMIHRLRKEGRFGKKLDKATLIDGIMAWAGKASKAELKEMLSPNSEFMKTLQDISGTFTMSGFDDGDLVYVKEKLLAAQNPPPEGKETNAIFDQLKAISEKQSKKNVVSRWSQDKDLGNQFKDILFDKSVKHPQTAIITKFNEAKLERWNELEQKIKDGTITEDESDEREKIFNDAYIGVQGLMDRAGVHHDMQKEISETLKSDGAKGAVYQKLVRLAKSKRPILNFGEDVLKQLSTLDPEGKEFAAIKNDTKLLEILKARTLGRSGFDSNKKQWDAIVRLIGRDVKLKDRSEAASVDNFKREHRVSRAKILSEKELAAQKAEVEKQKQRPEYWAGQLSYEYEKGYFTRDSHNLLQSMFEAQNAGVRIKDILDDLQLLNEEAYNYIVNGSKYACKIIQESVDDRRPITAKEVLHDSRKSVTLKRQVDFGEVEKLVDTMSAKDILTEAFDFKKFKGWIDEKKQFLKDFDKTNDPKVKESLKKEIDDLNIRIKRFDISPEFLKEFDNVLPPQKALLVKKAMRFKLGDALMEEGDNDVKKMFEAEGFTKADIKLIGMDVKAISNIETQKQSETGLQWSSQSSRMLQRDVAAAEFLTKGWDRNEKIPALEGFLTKEDLEKEKETLFESLKDAEEKLQEAQQKFEERKSEYDAKLASAIAALTSAVVFTLSMASGVGAAAGVIQLVWALASTAMQSTITEAVSMVTKGDRTGGITEKAEDFFFHTLAAEAGAITGLVGANLAFALDVKALGTFSQGVGSDGKPLLGAWDNILRTPFLKTAKGAISGIFSDIGTNFVKNLTDEKKSIMHDPIGDFKAWGAAQIKNLPKSYLKKLLMTSVTTGVGALAGELGWKEIKFLNPDAASANKYTKDGANREFKADDARLGFFDTDQKNFTEWFNGWGMFDASPKFGGKTDSPTDGFFGVFEEAIKGLQDPKMLTALANAAVWGTMDGTGGIKGQLGGLVDKAVDVFTAYNGESLDEETRQSLKDKMEKSFDAAITEKQEEILAIVKEGKYGKNLEIDEETLEEGKYSANQILDMWEKIDWIGDGGDAKNNLAFFNKVASVLGISDEQMKLYRREKECWPFVSIREYRNRYESNNADYQRILFNKDFLKQYIDDRSNDGTHPTQIEYTIPFGDQDIKNTKDLEDSLISIYEEWFEIKEMEGKEIKLIF